MPVLKTAYKVLIHGQEGVGKTSDAMKWPNPHYIDFEGSTERYDVERLPNKNPYFPPKSWSELLQIINNLTKGPDAQFKKTLVIDPIDGAIPYLEDHVIAKYPKKNGDKHNSLSDFGWDAGYDNAAKEFVPLLQALEDLRLKKNWHILLLCHTALRTQNLPEEEVSFDRWEPELHRRPKNTTSIYDYTKKWAEMILFYCFAPIIIESEENGKKAKASGERRVIRTQHSACWDAKNRHGLPYEIDLEEKKFALAHLFRDLTKMPDKPQPQSQPKTEPAKQPVPPETEATQEASAPVDETPPTPPGKVTEANLTALKNLMNGEFPEVTDQELMDAVAKQGYFPADMPVTDLPDEFVSGVLIAKWTGVLKAVNKLRMPNGGA